MVLGFSDGKFPEMKDRCGKNRRGMAFANPIDQVIEIRKAARPLTSLDQPLGDGLDVTKGALVDHLDAFADAMLVLLQRRLTPWTRGAQV